MKTQRANISKVYWPIIQTMRPSDILNGYFGGSNLTAEYLNDYSEEACNRLIGEWLDDNPPASRPDISAQDLIENPDYLLQSCASEFAASLQWLMRETGNSRIDAEWLLRHAKMHFQPWGNFYVFANPWSNACTDWFIIRAENESESYNILTTEFEQNFIIEEEDANEDNMRNDNGNPVCTDYLVLVGCISGE